MIMRTAAAMYTSMTCCVSQVVTGLLEMAYKCLSQLVYGLFGWTEVLLFPPVDNVRNILDFTCASNNQPQGNKIRVEENGLQSCVREFY